MFELMVVEGVGYLSARIENIEEKRKFLLYLMSKHTIQRFYWRSKFDDTYIELIEPKIYDAFDFIADCIGDPAELKLLVEEYRKRQGLLGYLDSCIKSNLTEDEIKTYAKRFWKVLTKEAVGIA